MRSIALRPYQSAMVDAIRDAFKAHRAVLLVSPTGSGKTVMFSYLADAVHAKGKRVFILVHREELIDQVSDTLKAFEVPHGFIAAGRPVSEQPVMVCSVFTLVNRVSAFKEPDLVIIDEAHHAAGGSSWARVMGNYRNAFKLGVTATPIRLDGRDLTGSFAQMVEGPTVAQLIEAGHLCRYRLYTPPVSLGKLRMRMGDYMKADMEAAVNKPTITGDAVAHYVKHAAGKRAIVFCVSLEHAAQVRDAFRVAGFTAERIDGGMDKSERKRLVARFQRAQVQVLTSCELVSEGFDLPAIEVAILLRPTASLGLYLQQVGRALRTHPGKSEAIILDHVGNAGLHGLPDDERQWTLGTDVTKLKKAKKTKTDFSLRRCGACWAAAKPGTMTCPHCGWAWPVESREVQQVAGELVAVEDLERTKRLEARREVGQSKTLEALTILEKQRGYKPGWALHVHLARRGRG